MILNDKKIIVIGSEGLIAKKIVDEIELPEDAAQASSLRFSWEEDDVAARIRAELKELQPAVKGQAAAAKANAAREIELKMATGTGVVPLWWKRRVRHLVGE